MFTKEIESILSFATESELRDILAFLKKEKLVQIIAEECHKFGSTKINENNLSSIIHSIYNEPLFKIAAEEEVSPEGEGGSSEESPLTEALAKQEPSSEKEDEDKKKELVTGTAYGISQWLSYWFGGEAVQKEGEDQVSSKMPLTEVGVFFKESEQFFNQLKSYIDRFDKSIKLDTEKNKNTKEEVQKFLEEVEKFQKPKNEEEKALSEQKINEFFNTYSASYRLSPDGYIMRNIVVDPETGEEKEEFAMKNPYQLGYQNLNKDNRETIEKYNQGLTKGSIEPVFEHVLHNIDERILELEDLIKSSYVYEMSKSVQTGAGKRTGGPGGSSKKAPRSALEEKGELSPSELSIDTEAGKEEKGIQKSFGEEEEEGLQQGRGGGQLIVGLKYLVDDAKVMLDNYEKYASESQKVTEKEKKDSASVKENYKKYKEAKNQVDRELADQLTKKKNLQNSNTNAISLINSIGNINVYDIQIKINEGRQAELTPEEAQILTRYPNISDLIKNIEIAEETILNYNTISTKVNELVATRDNIASELGELQEASKAWDVYFEGRGTYTFYKDKYNRFKQLLETAELELYNYKKLYEHLTGSNVDEAYSGDPESEQTRKALEYDQMPVNDKLNAVFKRYKNDPVAMRKIIEQVNNLLPKKLQAEPAPEMEDKTRLFSEQKPSEGEKAIEGHTQEDNIEFLKTEFSNKLNDYAAENDIFLESKNQVLSELYKSYDALVSKYKESKDTILSGISNLRNSTLVSKDTDDNTKSKNEFNLSGRAKKDLEFIKSKYENRIRAIEDLRKIIDESEKDGYDPKAIRSKMNKKYMQDKNVGGTVAYVSYALGDLGNYINALSDPNNIETKNLLEKNGINLDLLNGAFNEIKNVEYFNNGYLKVLSDNLKKIDKNQYKMLEIENSGINNFGKQLVNNIDVVFDKIHKTDYSKSGELFIGSQILQDSVEKVVNEEFVDIEKLKSMFEEMKRIPGLTELQANPEITQYRNKVMEQANKSGALIKKEITKGILSQLRELTSTINETANNVKKVGLNQAKQLFGDQAALMANKSELETINENLPRYEEVLKYHEDNRGEISEEQFTELYEKVKGMQDRKNNLTGEIKSLESGIKKPKQFQNFVDRILFPQKEKIIKMVGDPHDASYGDWVDNRTVEDLLQGIRTTKEYRRSPKDIEESRRNWYSMLGPWKGMVNQCTKSIHKVVSNPEHKYAAKENQYSPNYETDPGGALQKEISELQRSPKTNVTESQIKRLTRLKEKISAKTPDILNDEIKRLNPLSLEKSKKGEEYSHFIRALKLIKEKSESGKPLSVKEKAIVDEVKYTPAERDEIDRIKKKHAEDPISTEYKMLEPYKFRINRMVEERNAEKNKYGPQLKEMAIDLQKINSELETIVSKYNGDKNKAIEDPDYIKINNLKEIKEKPYRQLSKEQNIRVNTLNELRLLQFKLKYSGANPEDLKSLDNDIKYIEEKELKEYGELLDKGSIKEMIGTKKKDQLGNPVLKNQFPKFTGALEKFQKLGDLSLNILTQLGEEEGISTISKSENPEQKSKQNKILEQYDNLYKIIAENNTNTKEFNDAVREERASRGLVEKVNKVKALKRKIKLIEEYESSDEDIKKQYFQKYESEPELTRGEIKEKKEFIDDKIKYNALVEQWKNYLEKKPKWDKIIENYNERNLDTLYSDKYLKASEEFAKYLVSQIEGGKYSEKFISMVEDFLTEIKNPNYQK